MNSRAVQVRLSLEGGKQVETQLEVIGNKGQAALTRMDRGAAQAGRSTAAFRGQVQNAAFQVGDFAVQVAAGTSATRALAMQLPQLLGGFGVMGAVMGAVVAVAAPLVSKLFEASDATADLVAELTSAGGTASSVESAMGSVRDVARDYAEAIAASGGASSSAAALVIANSRAEFEARKEVLAVEIEIMRIRGQERAASEAALQSQVDAMGAGMMTDVGQSSGMRAQSRQAQGMSADLPASLAPGFSSVSNSQTVNAWLAGQQTTFLALRKLRAQGVLDDLALKAAEDAINSEFANIDTAAGAAGTGRGGRGGGGGGSAARDPKQVLAGVDAMVEALQGYADRAKDIGAEIGSAIAGSFQAGEEAVVQFVKTGKFEVRDLVTDMLAQFARLSTQHWITGPLAGLAGSLLGNIGGGFSTALQGALTSFDGGGYTGNGSRAGGLDGRGGFLAMLHPRESVIDHARGQSAGAPIVVNIQTRDAASFARSRSQVASDAARLMMAARRSM